MPTPRPSVLKRQREQKKKEKNAEKAERRAQRKMEAARGETDTASDMAVDDEPQVAPEE